MTTKQAKISSLRNAAVIAMAVFLAFSMTAATSLSNPRDISNKAFADPQQTSPAVTYKVYDISTLKPGQVMTPFGPMDASNVHEYNGTIVDAAAVMAKYGSNNPNLQKLRTPSSANDGWNEYAYWISPNSLSSFSGYWTVPSAPTATFNSTQVVFLFIGLQNSPITTIIQPVLQWGCSAAYCGNNWELASWMVIGNSAYYSHPISASTGDQIFGSMTNDFGQVWTITTKDVTQNTQTAEQVSTSTNFVEADVTLETYGLPSQCSYLPGNTDFTSLSINNGGTTPSWSAGYGATWCNMRVQAVSSSEVILHTQS